MFRIQSSVAIAVLACAASVAHAQDDSFEKRVPAGPSGVVEISNVAGMVEVAGWDRSEVEVKAQLDSEDIKVEMTSEAGRTRIRVVVPRRSGNDSDAQLQIRVPRASELEISTVSADINARDVTGEQRLKTVSGNVKTDIAAHDVEVKTVSGDLWLRGKSEDASLRLSTVSGNIRLERAAGELDAITVSGDMSLDVQPARSLRLRTTSGGVEFRGRLTRGASFEAETISGDLTVRARAEDGFEYEVSSFSGDIENCFDVEAQKTSRHGPGYRLSGKRGEGTGKVRMRTMSGDVDLCDR
jgi:DUF4097 and DUF4098 domain-containing protein YvlB